MVTSRPLSIAVALACLSNLVAPGRAPAQDRPLPPRDDSPIHVDVDIPVLRLLLDRVLVDVREGVLAGAGVALDGLGESLEELREAVGQRAGRRIPPGSIESTEPFSRSFVVGDSATLYVTNLSGPITVTAGGPNRIDVRATKRVWAQSVEDGRRQLGEVVITAAESHNRVELRTDSSTDRNAGRVAVDYTIVVPPNTSLELKSVSGDVTVRDTRGEVRAESISGTINSTGTPRLVSAKTVSGDVILADVGADTQLTVRAISGRIAMDRVRARVVDVNAISGTVRMTAWSGERAQIRTLSGRVMFDGTLAPAGRYDIESHSGDVHLSLAERPGFELEADTFNGGIQVDMPVRSEGPVVARGRQRRSVRGTYGDGAARLRIRTFTGDIVVTRR